MLILIRSFLNDELITCRCEFMNHNPELMLWRNLVVLVVLSLITLEFDAMKNVHRYQSCQAPHVSHKAISTILLISLPKQNHSIALH